MCSQSFREWAASRSCSDPGDAWAPVAERLRHVFGIANFSRAGRRAARRRCHRARDSRGSRRPSGLDVPRFRPASRQAVSADVAGNRARSRRPHQGSARLDGAISSHPELTIHVEALTHEAFYHFGKEAGPGGMPTGVSGRVVCAAVWRHRLTGGRVSLDAARLPRHPRALSQLPDPVARLAGEGARARGAADAVPAAHAALSGGVRRDSAAGGAGGAAAAAGGRSIAG